MIYIIILSCRNYVIIFLAISTYYYYDNLTHVRQYYNICDGRHIRTHWLPEPTPIRKRVCVRPHCHRDRYNYYWYITIVLQRRRFDLERRNGRVKAARHGGEPVPAAGKRKRRPRVIIIIFYMIIMVFFV